MFRSLRIELNNKINEYKIIFVFFNGKTFLNSFLVVNNKKSVLQKMIKKNPNLLIMIKQLDLCEE